MWRSVEGAASRSPSSGSLPDGAVGQTSKTVGADRVAFRGAGPPAGGLGACEEHSCPHHGFWVAPRTDHSCRGFRGFPAVLVRVEEAGLVWVVPR